MLNVQVGVDHLVKLPDRAEGDEDEVQLRAKARWYLDSGVTVVWLVLPDSRELVVLTAGGDDRFGKGQRLPDHPALPGLEPLVDDPFRQVAGV